MKILDLLTERNVLIYVGLTLIFCLITYIFFGGIVNLIFAVINTLQFIWFHDTFAANGSFDERPAKRT